MVQVYRRIRSLPAGHGLSHPRGLLPPLRLPQLVEGFWHVSTPLALDTYLDDEEELRQLVTDVLHGLAALHGLGIVHRDVRPINILQVTHCHALSSKWPSYATESALHQLTSVQGNPAALVCRSCS